jgi:hypothetical protein
VDNPKACGCPKGLVLNNQSCVSPSNVTANKTNATTPAVAQNKTPTAAPAAQTAQGFPKELAYGAVLVVLLAAVTYWYISTLPKPHKKPVHKKPEPKRYHHKKHEKGHTHR